MCVNMKNLPSQANKSNFLLKSNIYQHNQKKLSVEL